MNATAKFYAGFVVALSLLVALSFYLGYRAGAARDGAHPAARTTAATRAFAAA